MAITVQNLYDWIVVNWADKGNYREGTIDPVHTPTQNYILYKNTTNNKLWVWNKVSWQELGYGTSTTQFSASFVIADWVGPSAGYYTLPITHNLASALVSVEVWDTGNVPLTVERILTSNNIVTLRVPAVPDLRIDGLIWVKQ